MPISARRQTLPDVTGEPRIQPLGLRGRQLPHALFDSLDLSIEILPHPVQSLSEDAPIDPAAAAEILVRIPSRSVRRPEFLLGAKASPH